MTEPLLDEDLIYAAYGEDVPCMMSLSEAFNCDERATFLVRMSHQDGTDVCHSPRKAPFCLTHKDLLRRTFIGLWADLMPPKPCLCGQRVQIVSIEPFNAAP